MGQCYGKTHHPSSLPPSNGPDPAASPSPFTGHHTPTPSATSAWPSPYPHAAIAGVSPSPSRSAKSTPRRFFKRPFPPPSPAKHIRAALARRQAEPKEGAIPEESEGGGGVEGRKLDKRFGYGKNFEAKYEVIEEVGRGHFGHTCSARARKGVMKGQVVAVKIILKAKMTTAIAIEDVRREVKILKALSGHSNLVKFYDACEDALNVYIVMELCEGGELLDRILSRGGRYKEDDAKEIIVQILRVVAFCHLQGVVHRDLKPENFLFTTKDENAPMKLIDFGLSDFIRPAHPWLRDEQQQIPLDILIYKLVKGYIRATPFKRAALMALSRALNEDELIYFRLQFDLLGPNRDGHVSLENFRMALLRNATDAMKVAKVPDILSSLEPLAYKRLDFDEFCAASVNPYQLEALEEWEQIATTAFEHFEHEGNRVISFQELAKEMKLPPEAHQMARDWIRPSDGKLSLLGYTKFLHGVTTRSANTRHQ